MVLRWGVLGSGKIARDFACSMLAVDGCEIISVVRVASCPSPPDVCPAALSQHPTEMRTTPTLMC